MSPRSNNITDLVGDPTAGSLCVAMNGNQFMVVPELLELWRAEPGSGPVFLETLPPGLLAQQVAAGAIEVGTLRLALRPDVLAAGPDVLAELATAGLIGGGSDYASNDLSILATAAAAESLGDDPLTALGREGLRVAMPDPRTEGVGRLIVDALRSAGGEELVHRVMVEKTAQGLTRLTSIHHRESALWLSGGEADVAPLWSTEAIHHDALGAGLVRVPIADRDNQLGRYAVAVVNGSPRLDEAERFAAFLRGTAARALYARHGFGAPVAT